VFFAHLLQLETDVTDSHSDSSIQHHMVIEQLYSVFIEYQSLLPLSETLISQLVGFEPLHLLK